MEEREVSREVKTGPFLLQETASEISSVAVFA